MLSFTMWYCIYVTMILPLTMSADVIGKEEVELPDTDINMVGVDTETGVKTVWRLLQSFTICTLKRNCFEQNNLN